MVSMESFILKWQELLKEEREAEIEQAKSWQQGVPLKELQRRGICLLRLHLCNRRTGLYGRQLLKFGARGGAPDSKLPSNDFGPGDIVGLYEGACDAVEEQLASGVVTRVSASAVTVAFDEAHDALDLKHDGPYSLLKLANDITYKRLKTALAALNNHHGGSSGQMISVLFGISEPSAPLAHTGQVEFLNTALDHSQREAVIFALAQREVAIIHGPPGTGKTTTVVEIIQQTVRRGEKVLACAPSNVAVDNLVERLACAGVRVLRLGHPARLLDSVRSRCLDAMLARGDDAGIVRDVRSDMDKVHAKLRNGSERGERARLQAEMRSLRKELREREDTAMRNILQGADVILATTTGAWAGGPLKLLPPAHFAVAVVDECGQAVEAASWLPLLQAPRCVLAGDHRQLPPTIVSQSAAEGGLAVSLMERLVERLGSSAVRMLTVQYRMNAAIMDWASQHVYQGKLEAHPSVASHLLKDLPGVETTDETALALLLVDTAGCGLLETELAGEQSKGNPGEVDIVSAHVQALIDAGVKAEDIAVIAPYNLQVDMLRQKLSDRHPELEIRSVDGFQGREKEAVILSLVRSNRKGEVGFLAEDRRINVAVTRARRHLAVVCDSCTVRRHGFLGTLLDHMARRGETRTAYEYLQDIVPENFSHVKSADQPRTEGDKEGGGGARAKPQQIRDKTSGGRAPNSKVQAAVSATRDKRVDASTHKMPRGSAETATQIAPSVSSSSTLEELRKRIEGFVADPARNRLDFPATLNSHERMLVHQLAEELGLGHASTGLGNQRHVAAWKQGEGAPAVAKPSVANGETRGGRSEAEQLDEESSRKEPKKKASQKKSAERQCVESESLRAGGLQKEKSLRRDISEKDPSQNNALVGGPLEQKPLQASTNIKPASPASSRQQTAASGGVDLKSLHLERVEREHARQEEKLRQQKQQNEDPGKNGKTRPAHTKEVGGKSGKTGVAGEKAEEDFDAMFAAMVKANSRCAFAKCKTSVQTLGQHCQFCKSLYCLSHHIPEVHGCGEQARVHARRAVLRDGVLYPGSGPRERASDPARRQQLQRRFEKKMNEMASQRKPKQKDKDK
ncbi:DNA-binding protein SMUBP-2 isoform X2 [Lampetra planeri]